MAHGGSPSASGSPVSAGIWGRRTPTGFQPGLRTARPPRRVDLEPRELSLCCVRADRSLLLHFCMVATFQAKRGLAACLDPAWVPWRLLERSFAFQPCSPGLPEPRFPSWKGL